MSFDATVAMMPNSLIYYGTSEGQTAKVAQRIADRLREREIEVDLVEAPETPGRPLQEYAAILVGDSIHASGYHRPVLKFIRDNHDVIDQRPDGFFSVCLAAASKNPEERAKAKVFVDEMLEQTRWHPDRVAVFAGALAYSQYGLLKTWIMRRIAKAEGGDTDTSQDYEYTDWDDVDAFADAFAEDVLYRVRRVG